MEQAEPALHLLTGDFRDRPAREEGQDLTAEITAVDRERTWLPAPAVAGEDLLGHGLEQRIAGCLRLDISVIAQRHQHGPGAGARFGLGHDRRIADDLPDPMAPMLAVDEIALQARGHDADAVSLQFRVPDVPDGLAGPEGIDPALGEGEWLP